jgi:mannose-6-phosphate isomerase-like protein (cupin superfamily)
MNRISRVVFDLRTGSKIILVMGGLISSPAAMAQAQLPAAAPPAAGLNAMATSADVQALIAKAQAMPARPVIVQSIAGAGPYRVAMEYRKGPATASVHEAEGELDYVIDGAGSFVYGGTLVDSKRTNPTNLSGSGIEGGTKTRVAKGDWVILPPNTPHQTIPDDGVAVVLMTFHIPAAAAAH